jgi:NADP-dependent 3-hydroxy acid dehydrogenase YdfG
VALCARTEDALEAVARDINDIGGSARAAVVDVGDFSAVTDFMARVLADLGPVDVLINNAGMLPRFEPLTAWSAEDIDQTIKVNLMGTMYMTHAVLPSMIERGSGHIINVASDVGRRAIANMAPYVAAKHAVVGFSGSIMREVRESGVKVTVILPGIIDTYFGGNTEGSRNENWALRPEHTAGVLLDIARQPGNVVLDEVTIHPLGQDF